MTDLDTDVLALGWACIITFNLIIAGWMMSLLLRRRDGHSQDQ